MIDTTVFLALLFIFIRISSFFIMTKVFFPNGTPKTLKVFFALIFAGTLVSGVSSKPIEAITNNYVLFTYVFSEITTGLILGLITNVAFEVVIMAGSLMDVHIGLSMVNVLDPNSKANTSITGNLLHFIAMIIFFSINGHHMLIKSLIESFILVPLGQTIVSGESMMALIEVITKFFVIGLKIAIPIVLIIIITDLCMGLISRAVPQINVMVLGMPVKILLGLISITIALPIIIKVFIGSISYLPEIFRKIIGIMPIVFIFAAEEKTEEATPKKKQDSRKKGQIARSKDVGLALTMSACTLVIITLSGFLVSGLKANVIYFLGDNLLMDITETSLKSINITLVSRIAMGILPVALPIMLAGVIASLMQTGFLVSGEPIKPSLGKLNPIKGFKNMFSIKTFVELIKNLTMITIVGFIGYNYIADNFDKIMQVGNLYLPT
ncbi:MAG: flagellar biosynthetic protein FliR, partial [Clostridium sp.]